MASLPHELLRPWAAGSSRPTGVGSSVADRDAVWSLWQTARELGFCSSPPSSVDNDFPFGKQHLTMGHQVTRRPKLSVVKWVFSDPSSHEVGHTQQHPVIKWKWGRGDGVQAAPAA